MYTVSRNITIIVLIMLRCLPLSAQLLSSKPDSILAVVKYSYENGIFIRAELEARRALELRELSDSITIEFERYLAYSLVAQGNVQAAVDHFENILKIKESFVLDPVTTSPKILSAFEKARERFMAQRAKTFEPIVRQYSKSTPPVTYRMLLFPGWEQLYQGRATVGYLFLGSGVTAAGLTLYFSIELSKARKDYLGANDSQTAQKLYVPYNRFYKAQRVSMYAFLILYIASEIDVIMSLPQAPSVSLSSQSHSPKITVTLPILTLR